MKKNIFCIAFLLMGFLAFSQSYNVPSELPKEIEPFTYTPNYKEKIQYFEPAASLIVFGWSKDGKIAYAKAKHTAGRGGMKIIYTIQDMVTDKILYELEDDGAELTLEDSYANNKNTLNKKFKKYKIIVSDAEYLPPAALKNEGITFNVEILKVETTCYGTKTMAYSVTASKKNVGNKILGIYKEDGKETRNDVFVAGIIKSPYENRVAVLVGIDALVMEFSCYEWHLVGCATKYGFK